VPSTQQSEQHEQLISWQSEMNSIKDGSLGVHVVRSTRQIVAIHHSSVELAQLVETLGNGSRELIVFDQEEGQVTKVPNLGRDRTLQCIVG
jgi:hypothetical protein